MKAELLKIVCAEYQKMTDLGEVKADTYLPARHINFLKERLRVDYGFKIMKGCSMNTINDFVKAIQAACDFFEDLVKQTTEAAEQVCGCRYAPGQVLFANYSRKDSCIYKYKLCQILFTRHKIDFVGKTEDMKTAEDIAEYIFASL